MASAKSAMDIIQSTKSPKAIRNTTILQFNYSINSLMHFDLGIVSLDLGLMLVSSKAVTCEWSVP